MSLLDGGRPKNLSTISPFLFVPLLTLSHTKVIGPNTRRPARESYVHIYKFNKLSTFCMSPLLILSHPKVTVRSRAGQQGKTTYIFTNLLNSRRSACPRHPDDFWCIRTDRSGNNHDPLVKYDWEKRRNIEQQPLVNWSYSNCWYCWVLWNLL